MVPGSIPGGQIIDSLALGGGVGSHVIYAAVLLPDPLKFALLADLHFLYCVLI